MNILRLRALWRATPLLKRTAAAVGIAFVGVQVHKALNPEHNYAHNFFWNSSKNPPEPPPTPTPTRRNALTIQVEPYGPSGLPYPEAEMKSLTKAAVQLFRMCLVGNNKGIQDFAITLTPLWAEFALKEARQLANEDEVKKAIKECVKKFDAQLPKEGQQVLKKILPILGATSVEQIFIDAAKKVRDPTIETIGDSMPHALRVLTRLTELRKWNDYLSEEDDEFDTTPIKEAPLLELPQIYMQLFEDHLRKRYPRLDSEVTNIMGELACLRAKMGLVSRYIPEDTLLELTRIDEVFNLFSHAYKWKYEYIATKTTTPIEQFIIDKAKKEKLDEKDTQLLVTMAKNFTFN